MIISPCISICKTDPVTGYCYGCGRSNEDKKKWKNADTTDSWKKNNIIEIEKRLNGWQLKRLLSKSIQLTIWDLFQHPIDRALKHQKSIQVRIL